ncbi:C-C chemokine receptor type 9 [Merluccius polli]|uniref:C-C chemokine receptor type 9 n=1 Tax=Merluccius polli TaxID=89951 RepID=A0AA47M3M7_MERPO|nr:C-C chemokine receptor type 9 [Merluccius polli]
MSTQTQSSPPLAVSTLQTPAGVWKERVKRGAAMDNQSSLFPTANMENSSWKPDCNGLHQTTCITEPREEGEQGESRGRAGGEQRESRGRAEGEQGEKERRGGAGGEGEERESRGRERAEGEQRESRGRAGGEQRESRGRGRAEGEQREKERESRGRAEGEQGERESRGRERAEGEQRERESRGRAEGEREQRESRGRAGGEQGESRRGRAEGEQQRECRPGPNRDSGPCLVFQDSGPCLVFQDSGPCLVFQDSGPCLVFQDSGPCLVFQDSGPCLVFQDSGPCLVFQDSGPCLVFQDSGPCLVFQDSGSGYPDEDYDLDSSDDVCSKGWVRDFQRRFEPPLFLLIFALGTAGNLLVVLLYAAVRRRLKTMTDVYLLNLAVADLLFLATLPFWAVNAARGWVFGPHAAAFCKAVAAVYKLNLFSGMLLLACVSVDRYLAVVMVTWVRSLRREARMLYSRAASLAAWLLASLLALPEVPFAQVRESSAGLPSCELMSRAETWAKLLVLSLQVCVGFVLPLVVMTTCYSFVLRALLRARSFRKHKALRVVLAVVAVFVASQLPYNGHLMLQALQVANSSSSGAVAADCGAATRSDVAGQVVKSLAYTRACVNPFLYAFVGVRFRRDLLRVLAACAGRLRGGGGDKVASGPKRPSVMSDTETTAALSL